MPPAMTDQEWYHCHGNSYHTSDISAAVYTTERCRRLLLLWHWCLSKLFHTGEELILYSESIHPSSSHVPSIGIWWAGTISQAAQCMPHQCSQANLDTSPLPTYFCGRSPNHKKENPTKSPILGITQANSVVVSETFEHIIVWRYAKTQAHGHNCVFLNIASFYRKCVVGESERKVSLILSFPFMSRVCRNLGQPHAPSLAPLPSEKASWVSADLENPVNAWSQWRQTLNCCQSRSQYGSHYPEPSTGCFFEAVESSLAPPVGS